VVLTIGSFGGWGLAPCIGEIFGPKYAQVPLASDTDEQVVLSSMECMVISYVDCPRVRRVDVAHAKGTEWK
jgi:hypothetical protein